MKIRTLFSSVCVAVLLTSCAEKALVLPSMVEQPFEEDSAPAKDLRLWVADNIPSGTMLVDYHREDAWDGTVDEEWILDRPEGFASFKRVAPGRNATQMPSATAYEVLEIRLRRGGVRIDGERPKTVWSLDWETNAPKTSIRGDVYAYSGGELLRIERITVK